MTTKSKSPYQVMRSLTTDEYRTLVASIKEHGIIDPVLKDEHGNTIDGHHRERAAKQLGIECPTKVLTGFNEDELTRMARSLNWARRQLSTAERREYIGEALKANPKAANRAIARATGFDDKTVASVRRELEETAELPQVDKTVGGDGVERKAKRATKKPKPKPEPAVDLGTEDYDDDPVADTQVPDTDDDGGQLEFTTLFDEVMADIANLYNGITSVTAKLEGAGLEADQWESVLSGLVDLHNAVTKAESNTP